MLGGGGSGVRSVRVLEGVLRVVGVAAVGFLAWRD